MLSRSSTNGILKRGLMYQFTKSFASSKPGSHRHNIFRANSHLYDRRSNADRRSGGVAVLVHASYNSMQISIQSDPECKFLAIEVKLKPTPLLIYMWYSNKFESSLAFKHNDIIRQLTARYLTSISYNEFCSEYSRCR